jgi:hypothetical protein
LPSTAFEAGYEALSVDDAVAVCPCDSNVDAAEAVPTGATSRPTVATTAAATAASVARHLVGPRRTMTELIY